MIRLFVAADDTDGTPLIADHYEFVTIPRIGEEIVIDKSDEEMVLRVIGVLNFAQPKGEVINPVSYIHLKCEPVR